jgi:hypothetical protein
MSSVIVLGGRGKLAQNWSTSAAVRRAASIRDGMFSRRLMVDCEHSGAPLRGHRPGVVDARGIAPVADGAGQTVGNAEPAFRLAKQQQAAVG